MKCTQSNFPYLKQKVLENLSATEIHNTFPEEIKYLLRQNIVFTRISRMLFNTRRKKTWLAPKGVCVVLKRITDKSIVATVKDNIFTSPGYLQVLADHDTDDHHISANKFARKVQFIHRGMCGQFNFFWKNY